MCYHCETKLGNICCLGLKNGWLIEEQNNKKETKVCEHNLNKLTESCYRKIFLDPKYLLYVTDRY